MPSGNAVHASSSRSLALDPEGASAPMLRHYLVLDRSKNHQTIARVTASPPSPTARSAVR
jgi:hypothetical protein